MHNHVSTLAAELVERGHDVTVAGPESYAGVGTRHVRLDMVRALAPGADAAAGRRLGAIVRRLRPRVVHAHSSKAGALARIGRIAGAPVVYTPHGFAFAGHFDSERQRSAYRLAERVLVPATAMTLCVCEAERRLAAGIGARRLAVVHNGVAPPPPGRADPRLDALGGSGPIVATVMGLRPGKGAETFVDAAARVLRSHPHARFAIAGDGPLRGAVEARIARAGLGERVLLLGATDGSAPLLRGAGIVVSASWAESFPYSVLEGMAAGLPVVATDVGGTAEAIEDGRTGLLVPPRDSAALAAAVGVLLDDAPRRQAMGRAGAERAAARFSLRGMGDGVAAVYERVAR